MKRRLRGFAGSIERADRGLLFAVVSLLFVGSIIVFGAGSYTKQALRSPLGEYFIILKHLFMIGVGLVTMMGLMHFDYRRYRTPWLRNGALIATYALVALTLVTARTDAAGHAVINRWVTIAGFTFQPVELAKLAMIIFLAERLTCLRRGQKMSGRRLMIALGLGPLPLLYLLIEQPNFGNVMVTAGVTLVILFAAGINERRLLWATFAMPLAGVLGYFASSKVKLRVDDLITGLNGGSFGFQVDQSLTGIGAGGLTGLGPGQSHNKFSFLPESHTDFAFSVLGEELGLGGTLLVIFLIVLFAWRGYGIAARAREPFGRALAAGLTTAIAIYGVANIAMVTGIFPVVGVPLPFVSYGGTAMVAALASVGILLNIEQGGRSHNQWKRRWDRGGAA